MKRFVTALALGAAMLAMVCSLGPREPAMGDRPLAYWLDRLNGPGEQHAEAIAAFQQCGPRMVPELRRVLRQKPLALRVWWRTHAPRYLSSWRQSPDPARRRAAAAQALRFCGAERPAACPELIGGLGDPVPFVAEQCAKTLVDVGGAAADALGSALADPRVAVRSGAAVVLAKIGAPARPAQSRLIQSLRDSSPAVRAPAAAALGQMNDFTAESVRGLAAALSDVDARVRAEAAAALAKAGSAAALAVSPLAQALDDGDQAVRVSVANALGKVGPAAELAVPNLVQNLDDPVSMVRASSALALGRIGPGAAAAAPRLIQGLRDPDSLVQSNSAIALGKIGEPAFSAAPALAQALRAETLIVRLSAAEALGRIGPAAAAAVAALREACNDDHSGVGRYARVSLRQITGSDAYAAAEE